MSNHQGMVKGFFSKRNLIIIGVLLLVVVVGINIQRVRNKDLVTAETGVVTEKELVQTVQATGKVVATDKKVIYSQVTGSVQKIHVKLGEEVEPGKPLMELDIPDGPQRLAQARAALAKAESDLAKARSSGSGLELIDAESSFDEAESGLRLAEEKLNRHQVLYQEGGISLENLQEVQSQMTAARSRYQKAKAALEGARAGASAALQGLAATADSARASLALLEKQMGQGGLKSDISGRVLSLGVREGDMVTPNMILITVGSIENLQVVAYINEADAPLLEVGQRVMVTGSSIADRQYSGQLLEVGLEARNQVKNDSESSDLPVTISLPAQTLLRPGYNVDLEITTQVDQRALVVPYEAVIEKDGVTHVWVLRDGRAHLQEVVPGIADNFDIQITEGLKKGENVIVKYPPELKEGSRVRNK